jgi:hypothetical protein
MEKENQRIPTGVKSSWFFLAVAIVGVIPMVVVVNSPQWSEPQPNGFGFTHESFRAVLAIILISIPAAAWSLLAGLFARKESALSYISIVPTLGFLLYCGYMFLKLRR